ncbi:Two-component response regulator, AmiR/NasT family, consists of REC and RNA-binding antiterminator (ANTAR) domains [Roseateles sp. YR242]|uniref:type IV pili methyl-accepting chemotaxis transducer N-terminal domain-containing protein n=1 Tax=Roseateles sp. YR242 TaxID=1855305 RepID=UPI0008CD980B|nr:type IV pili methyl-accepting chemotaxis transducer N-terminal domain-containing protein [Roseateles sp. YR242]SEK69196.1 Two-component response regulator, AmiR/NasT family, consists of REC and RNA-binding antiterminator (ANTAR) domains [Roseateles sp. YR242]
MIAPASPLPLPTAPTADEAPARVLLLGQPWLAREDKGAPMHWICAHLHQDERNSLVHAVQAHAPDALLLHADSPAALEAWLDTLEAARAAGSAEDGRQLPPGVCVSADTTPQRQRRALALGVEVWLEAPVSTEALHRQLRWAVWRAQAHAAQLALIQGQLDDRKWTERAKGLLMTARDLDEGGAFRLLREAAMHAHLRLGEVARSVVHAAQRAEAVNLAGQQRMLSQRLVKLMAQRAAGIEAKRAKLLQDESCERVSANLARLPSLLAADVDLAALTLAWERLQRCLRGKPDLALLLEADAAAQTLLDLSDRLATDIAAAGMGRPLHIVNLCGRQRMLSQQLTKEALLADLLPQRDAGALADSLDRFAAGLVELEAAPLSSEAIRALQAEVGAEWLRLMRCLRDTHGKEAATGLARSSEVLLHQLDMLTGLYQQSLQLILG